MNKTSLGTLLLLAGVVILAAVAVLALLDVGPWLLISVSAGVAGIALYLVHFWLNRDLRHLWKRAEELKPQERKLRFGELRTSELHDLAQKLNQALASFDQAIGHLAVHRTELRLLLGTLEDPLWSQDDDGNVLWANAPFHKLFPAFDSSREQSYREIIRDPELQEAILSSGNAGEQLPLSLNIAGHSYMLSSSRSVSNRRYVFILHNIDAMERTARMKKDFIVNLAHELRTPLTAIKGFTEAMQDTPGQDHTRHQKIILSHTNRLIHLIRDLEQLIRLESISRLEASQIELKPFFANLSLILEPDIQAKGLSLSVELEEGLERMVCDPFRFEQIFINLVQNSLRYTDTGGITIHVGKEGENTVFTISDTGRGIQNEHLDRIFERFYVADNSRNRDFSGTGLGLAIVKHIVVLHHGEISVSSEMGRGTTFKISIPPLAERKNESNQPS